MSKKQRTAEEKYPGRKIGDKVGDFTVIDIHRGAEAWILSQKLQTLKPNVEIVAAEHIVMSGALGAPIWNIWMRVTWLTEDFMNGEGYVNEVLLLETSCGAVEGWMNFLVGDDGRPLEGEAAHPKFASQEERLKFLSKFEMDEGMFDELNPPWRDL